MKSATNHPITNLNKAGIVADTAVRPQNERGIYCSKPYVFAPVDEISIPP